MTGGRVCGVVGDPIGHSLSPVLHRAGFEEHGLEWSYDAHRVPAGGLRAFVDGLGPEWRGLSVTMPLKREAAALADELTGRARLSGGANTIVLGDGRRRCDNTDIPGAVAAVRERTDEPVGRVTILGGGATATSTGLAAAELGARSVALVVRSPERAAESVAALRAHPSSPEVSVTRLDDTAPFACDLLVSTIPATAQTADLRERCARVPAIFEALYDPWPTPLAADALAAGRVLVGGLDLLVHQAAVQFEQFTGLEAPLARMRAAGEAALAVRAADRPGGRPGG
ncbi:MAG TPA: shikimate dehydrogenase [Nocardioides sp.]